MSGHDFVFAPLSVTALRSGCWLVLESRSRDSESIEESRLASRVISRLPH